MSDDNMTVEELDKLPPYYPVMLRGADVWIKGVSLWREVEGTRAFSSSQLVSRGTVSKLRPELKPEPLDLLAAIKAQPKLSQLNRRPGTVVASLCVINSDGSFRPDFPVLYIISEPGPTPEEQLAAVFERSADDVRAALDRLGLTVEPKPSDA